MDRPLRAIHFWYVAIRGDLTERPQNDTERRFAARRLCGRAECAGRSASMTARYPPPQRNPANRTTSPRTSNRSRRHFFFRENGTAHPLRCGSSPQKVTLGSPVRLQARSQRLAVATNLLRANPLSTLAPKMNRPLRAILFWPMIKEICSATKCFPRKMKNIATILQDDPSNGQMIILKGIFRNEQNPNRRMVCKRD